MKKLLFTLCFSLFASSAMACANFTGTYQAYESGTVYSVSQSDCTALVVSDSEGSERIIADGRFRVSSDDEVATIYVAATFVGETNLLLDAKLEYKIEFPPGTPMEMVPTRVTINRSLDARGNIVSTTVFYNSDGGVIETSTGTDQRI